MSRPTARFESSFRPAEAAPVWAALALGLVTLTLAWALLHLPAFDRFQIIDTPVYQEYGEAMADGRVPYRDFEVEYPPAALPLFWLPTLAPAEHYESVFDWLMWACAAAAIVFALAALVAQEASPLRLTAAAVFMGLAPLALGSVVLSRYDFWPAALVAAAVAALVSGKERAGFGVLGLAVAAKIYPVVLLPVALAYVWRRRGPREAALGLVAFAGVVAAVALPFLLVAADGLWESLSDQLGRPLQIESLGSGLLLAADQLGLYDAGVVSTHGSQNLAGSFPDALAVLLTLAQAAALVAVWALFARGTAGGDRFFAGSAAAVAAFVAFAKVLSPQFLIWLVPLVPLVRGRRGVFASGVLAAALVLTQLWFPFRYWRLALEFDAAASWLVFARDLTLLVLLAVLMAGTRAGRART
jgi:uncharacterized membrane protein